MARFYGTMQGGRGATSRTGTTSSGVHAHVRGWDVGVKVYAGDDKDTDVIYVYATHGSRGAGLDRHIATIRKDAHGQLVVTSHPSGTVEVMPMAS